LCLQMVPLVVQRCQVRLCGWKAAGPGVPSCKHLSECVSACFSAPSAVDPCMCLLCGPRMCALALPRALKLQGVVHLLCCSMCIAEPWCGVFLSAAFLYCSKWYCKWYVCRWKCRCRAQSPYCWMIDAVFPGC
jgi:hypothetical protein